MVGGEVRYLGSLDEGCVPETGKAHGYIDSSDNDKKAGLDVSTLSIVYMPCMVSRVEYRVIFFILDAGDNPFKSDGCVST